MTGVVLLKGTLKKHTASPKRGYGFARLSDGAVASQPQSVDEKSKHRNSDGGMDGSISADSELNGTFSEGAVKSTDTAELSTDRKTRKSAAKETAKDQLDLAGTF